MRVLVVEDDATLSAVVNEALEEEGHAVTCVPTSAEAADLLDREPWDVVLMDGFGSSFDEPDTAVRETLGQLSSKCPVVVSTGRAWAHTSDAADLGVASILPKPYDLDTLVSALEKAARGACTAAR